MYQGKISAMKLTLPLLYCNQDYHVIFIDKRESDCHVYDLDSTLNFPCHFEEYLEQAIKNDDVIPIQFQR